MALELEANREPDFNSLVEPFSPRRVAARVFYLLLGERGLVLEWEDSRMELVAAIPQTHTRSLYDSALGAADHSRGTRKTIRAPPDPPRAPILLMLEPCAKLHSLNRILPF